MNLIRSADAVLIDHPDLIEKLNDIYVLYLYFLHINLDVVFSCGIFLWYFLVVFSCGIFLQ